MGGVVSFITGWVAPMFIIASPITSYGDQILSMHKNNSSAGFSLDIPFIMLTASILKVFYYPGAQYDTALLIQAMLMIVVHLILLKVALDNRPGFGSRETALPFAASREGDLGVKRPFDFWQWKSPKPYWQFLLYLFIILVFFELLLAPLLPIYDAYSSFIGYLGLSIEAILPVPQILSNSRTRSCKGFRLSVLGSWLAGDLFKMFWFFNATTEIPWAFKMCGIFQMCCDAYLGIQFFTYGSGMPVGKDVELNGISRARTPVGAKEGRVE